MNDHTTTNDALAAVVARAGPANFRAWSIAVSFLGDCVVPRAGDVGMATITQVLAAFGIDPGVTRPSMSRLAGEGWVTRQKVGRNSFYSLTPVALAASQAASRGIYAAQHPQDPCSWRVYLGGGLPQPEQTRLRNALRRRGAAELGSPVCLLPAGQGSRPGFARGLGQFVGRGLGGAIRLTAEPLPPAPAPVLSR